MYSDVQRRMMTTAEDGNVHALAIAGHIRRLSSDREGHVRITMPFRDQVRLSGVNSIN